MGKLEKIFGLSFVQLLVLDIFFSRVNSQLTYYTIIILTSYYFGREKSFSMSWSLVFEGGLQCSVVSGMVLSVILSRMNLNFFHSLFPVSIGQLTADKMDEGLGKDILWKYCCL